MSHISSEDSGHLHQLPEYTGAEAGNPFIAGWYIRPGCAVFDGQLWLYPTSSNQPQPQTSIDAFSSHDLINWTKHANALTIANIPWATGALGRTTPIARNRKYYLYFTAEGIDDAASESAGGGIGVAVSDKPEGPFVDALGKPLITSKYSGSLSMDQDVFVDDVSRTAYLYYSDQSHAYVATLNEDMVSVNASSAKEITPQGFGSGPRMIKRKGIYYFTWSEGNSGDADSCIAYAMSDSPLGPFRRIDAILQGDDTVAKGIGHHSFLQVPGTDVWYIFYDRQALSEDKVHRRTLAYDRVYFSNDGGIIPIVMLVKDNFANGEMLAWNIYGGEWSVEEQRLASKETSGGMAMLDTNFPDFVFDATIQPTKGTGHPGLLFRVNELSKTTFKYKGYKAALSPSGVITLGKADLGTFTDLAQTRISVIPGEENRVRVVASGSELRIFVNDMVNPRLTHMDSSFSSGANGVRVYNVAARFGNVSIRRLDGSLELTDSFREMRYDGVSITSSEATEFEKCAVVESRDEIDGETGARIRRPHFSLKSLLCGMDKLLG